MSSQPLKNILLIGANGSLATTLTKHISADPAFSLTILSREGSKSVTPPNTKLVKLPAPYQAEALGPVLKHQDAVINLIGPFDLEAHKTVIDAAIKAGVKRYIPPHFSAKSEDSYVTSRASIAAVKVKITEMLKMKEKEGLSWTSVGCGGFLDWGITEGFLGFDTANHKAVLYNNGTSKMDLTLLSDIARAVIGILNHAKETQNRYVYINTFFTSPAIILSVLEKQIGQTFEREVKDAERANQEGSEAVAKGDFGGARDMLMGMIAGADESVVNGYGKDNELLLGHGTRPEGELEEVVGRILKGKDV